jgi:transposase InsO family protein
MPWQELTRMALRLEFCVFASRPEAVMSALCRQYGISRKTGYKWLARYRAEGDAGVVEQSRRPRTMPHQTPAAMERQVVQLRAEQPTWGGRKLERRLQDMGIAAVPAASTITTILHRHDLIDPAESVAHTPMQRFEAEAPNDLWQLDFKGHFPLHRARCHPIQVLDDHSRFVLGLVACANEQLTTVLPVLTALFRRYGLPRRLLCDNGAPWGSTLGELTAFDAWLVRLDIRLIHGRPYHPQTQGKLERVNRTLAADVVVGRSYRDLAAAQRAFDTWRQCYNHERPHEALDLATPITRYLVSPRRFPEVLPSITYEPGDEIRLVDREGSISLGNKRYKISRALPGLPVALRPTTTDGVWNVYFCHRRVRTVDQHTRADPGQ